MALTCKNVGLVWTRLPLSLSEIKQWRASLDPATESSNAAAYRLVRSILQSARRS
jgi:hypothetical protein